MILVTGFGPYRESANASAELVASLRDEPADELVSLNDQLAFEVITCDDTSRETEHLSLEARLDELLKQHRPSLCIHTGQAPSRNRISIEKIATNSFMREVIDPARPVAYWSNLPGTDELSALLENHGIPADYSFDCGQHLCNHILFSSLHFSERNGHSHKAGFIHIPLLPEQVMHVPKHRNSPFMPLEMTRKALSLIILHAASMP